LLRQVRIVDVDGAVQVSKPLTGWNDADADADDGEGGDGGDGGDGEGGEGGDDGWTISTGQPRGTPRQLVEAGFVAGGADAFPAAARAGAAWAVAADAGGWASGASRADSSARRLVPVVARPGGDAGADCAVDSVPARAGRSV
jgi:hypothetical protein